MSLIAKGKLLAMKYLQQVPNEELTYYVYSEEEDDGVNREVKSTSILSTSPSTNSEGKE